MKWVFMLYFQISLEVAGHKGQGSGTLVHGELKDLVVAEW